MSADNVSVNLHIVASKHGVILGPGGTRIKALQSEHGVIINVPRREAQSSVVVVSGSAVAVETVKALLQELLAMEISHEPLVVAQVEVPAPKHGAIIGKGGATLKDIQSKSLAYVEVPKRDDSSDVITVTGTKEAVKRAVDLISETLGYPVSWSKKKTDASSKPEFKKLPLTGKITEALFFNGVSESDQKSFDRFLSYVKSTKQTLDVCVFTLTDDEITRALIEAHYAGVKVRLITDDEQCNTTGSDVKTLHEAGVPVRMDASVAHMHHKFAVLDKKVLINGSFNWTRQGHNMNRENVMITSKAAFVKAFAQQFELLWAEFAENPLKF